MWWVCLQPHAPVHRRLFSLWSPCWWQWVRRQCYAELLSPIIGRSYNGIVMPYRRKYRTTHKTVCTGCWEGEWRKSVGDSMAIFWEAKVEYKHFFIVFIPKLGYGKVDNIFLVPMHGGIWTLCIDLTSRELHMIEKHGFRAKARCVSYLAESVEVTRHDQLRYEYQHLDYQYSPHPNLSMMMINGL